jgi:hypothetical protein
MLCRAFAAGSRPAHHVPYSLYGFVSTPEPHRGAAASDGMAGTFR